MGKFYSLREAQAAGVFSGCSLAFGVFDGVHVGHRALISKACEHAHATGAASLVLTFDVDPDELFGGPGFKKLMSNEARIEALSACGVDAVVALPFSREFAAQSPNDFLDACFGKAAPGKLFVGEGFRFGNKASGTVADLRAWGEPSGMQLEAVPLVSLGGAPVSATRIRELLREGKVAQAAELLGRFYRVGGEVVSGRGEGADMGIRTANLDIPEQLQALGDGVYAAYAWVGDERYKAAVNIGVAATFADRATANCEAHILDFSGDIYGQRISLEFVEWLRPMRVFDDIDELIATINSNITWVRENL